MDPSAVLSLVLGGLTLVAVVASAVAVARATLAKTTIETLKQNNEALAARVDLLEEENERQATRLSALQSENTALQSYVSGTDAIKEVAAMLAKADTARATEHHEILASVQAVATIFTSSHKETLDMIRATCHTSEHAP